MLDTKASKTIRELEKELVLLGRIIAVEKFIISLEQQRIGEVIDVTRSVPPGASAQAVVDDIIPVHEFQIIDQRQAQIQPCQLVPRLYPPSLGPDGSEIVASIPG